jgi:hypothetical protein
VLLDEWNTGDGFVFARPGRQYLFSHKEEEQLAAYLKMLDELTNTVLNPVVTQRAAQRFYAEVRDLDVPDLDDKTNPEAVKLNKTFTTSWMAEFYHRHRSLFKRRSVTRQSTRRQKASTKQAMQAWFTFSNAFWKDLVTNNPNGVVVCNMDETAIAPRTEWICATVQFSGYRATHSCQNAGRVRCLSTGLDAYVLAHNGLPICSSRC